MTDPRWTRSRDALIDALTASLDHGVAPSITSLVSAAGVTRPTFYQHFGDLPTAYREAGRRRMQAEFDRARALGPVAPDDAETDLSIVTGLLSHLLDHATFYCLVLAHGGRPVEELIICFVAKHIVEVSPYGVTLTELPETVRSDLATTLAAGVAYLIIEWLGHTRPEPPAEMAGRVVAVLGSLTGAPRRPLPHDRRLDSQ